MGEKFLIDTNVLIDLQNGIIPQKGTSKLAEIIDEGFIISFITYIEFLWHRSVSERLERFVELAHVITVNKQIINQTVAIRKTNRIKLPDAIIAATAIVHGLTLVTHNIDDFKK